MFVWTVYYASVFNMFCLFAYLMHAVTAVVEFNVQATVHRDKFLQDLYHCCVYSEKLLMMDRGTVRNM